jgi:hypothetical protein
MTCDKLAGLHTLSHHHIPWLLPYGATAGHGSSIEPQERHLKDLKLGDEGYSMRCDVRASTGVRVEAEDVFVPLPARKTLHGRASRTTGAVASVAEANKRRLHAAVETCKCEARHQVGCLNFGHSQMLWQLCIARRL